ncbi:hypothetical protein CBOM_01125 [Ceraceosorus bombacis]|uniref:Uncharacterized protein n=1 Tax=Ceraceosorus bombacis TaxID=401625 RepID=A0A0P1BCT0_9BASI|nr:hypothetical protein CBOM_01125 [Ceraceosorus bombacis]
MLDDRSRCQATSSGRSQPHSAPSHISANPQPKLTADLHANKGARGTSLSQRRTKPQTSRPVEAQSSSSRRPQVVGATAGAAAAAGVPQSASKVFFNGVKAAANYAVPILATNAHRIPELVSGQQGQQQHKGGKGHGGGKANHGNGNNPWALIPQQALTQLAYSTARQATTGGKPGSALPPSPYFEGSQFQLGEYHFDPSLEAFAPLALDYTAQWSSPPDYSLHPPFALNVIEPSAEDMSRDMYGAGGYPGYGAAAPSGMARGQTAGAGYDQGYPGGQHGHGGAGGPPPPPPPGSQPPGQSAPDPRSRSRTAPPPSDWPGAASQDPGAFPPHGAYAGQNPASAYPGYGAPPSQWPGAAGGAGAWPSTAGANPWASAGQSGWPPPYGGAGAAQMPYGAAAGPSAYYQSAYGARAPPPSVPPHAAAAYGYMSGYGALPPQTATGPYGAYAQPQAFGATGYANAYGMQQQFPPGAGGYPGFPGAGMGMMPYGSPYGGYPGGPVPPHVQAYLQRGYAEGWDDTGKKSRHKHRSGQARSDTRSRSGSVSSDDSSAKSKKTSGGGGKRIQDAMLGAVTGAMLEKGMEKWKESRDKKKEDR